MKYTGTITSIIKLVQIEYKQLPTYFSYIDTF